ncbi:hypothetical protein B484DRAFT_409675, partial [Ochromonadaceae sp. CCMP2298]
LALLSASIPDRAASAREDEKRQKYGHLPGMGVGGDKTFTPFVIESTPFFSLSSVAVSVAMDPASKVVMEMMEQGQGQGQMEAEGLHNRGPKPTQVQGQGQGQGRGQKADERSSVIFFDAIHPSFSPQVFLQQFMAHFCPPLVFCWGCPANQGYHYTSSLFYLIFNWGHPLCIILMLVSFAFR